MIIDIHSHCFPDSIAGKAVSALTGKAGIPAFSEGTVKSLKQSMITANIDICVLQHIATNPEQNINVNRWAAGIQDEKIISFGTIHPDLVNWKEEVNWLAASGFKGVKFHPEYQDFYVDDIRVFPLYEELCKAGLIILFHAGADLGYPPPYHCTPSRLSNVLIAFPGAKIIAAHMGGFQFWDDVEKFLLGRDIYLDTSFAYDYLGSEAMLNFIKNHGTDKVLFGTDSPWADQTKEAAKIKSLGLTREEIDLVMSGNSLRLLKI